MATERGGIELFIYTHGWGRESLYNVRHFNWAIPETGPQSDCSIGVPRNISDQVGGDLFVHPHTGQASHRVALYKE